VSGACPPKPMVWYLGLNAGAPARILAVVGSISVDAERLVSVAEEEVGAISRRAQHATWTCHKADPAAGAAISDVSRSFS
jgi:hypothetical protein